MATITQQLADVKGALRRSIASINRYRVKNATFDANQINPFMLNSLMSELQGVLDNKRSSIKDLIELVEELETIATAFESEKWKQG